jgi:hypothetical protein
MLVSAEIRWFWDKAPAGLEDWFRSERDFSCPPGGPEIRADEYLKEPGQIALGIKRRDKKPGIEKPGIEIKGLVAVTWNGVTAAPFIGPIERWVKWTSTSLELGPKAIIEIHKKRWLRKFDTGTPWPREVPLDAQGKRVDKQSLPALGCNVEFTQVSVPSGAVWWTFGFEAFGSLHTVENDLRATTTMLAARRPPALEGGILASYPAWLSQHVREKK